MLHIARRAAVGYSSTLPMTAGLNKEKGMLVLTRKTGDKIIIGDSVEVTVLSVTGNQVRVGVRAPKDVPVHREEIYQRIQLEKQPR